MLSSRIIGGKTPPGVVSRALFGWQSLSSSSSSGSATPPAPSTTATTGNKNNSHARFMWGGAAAAAVVGAGIAVVYGQKHLSQLTMGRDLLFATANTTTSCDDGATTARCAAAPSPSSDVLGLGNPTKEPSTGIVFPHLCNGLTFAGCGVRVKYGLVKVYAVGTYVDPKAIAAVKKDGAAAVGKAMVDPNYPRTIRIVMNRGLSMDKYTKAIVEALEPRMKGQDTEKLDEFIKLNPKVDLVKGAVMEMTVRGDTMHYKNSVGGIGQIRSIAFTQALCDVYYGNDAVSSGHRDDVVKGIMSM